tara:strand:+ start:216 stop:446 length:231 start_codon:yes stop_codon:yes gene_type:complete
MFLAIKKLTGIKRLDNSINGNPNYVLVFDDEEIRTEKDSMLAYKISDTYLNKDCQITFYYDDQEQAFLKEIDKLEE